MEAQTRPNIVCHSDGPRAEQKGYAASGTARARTSLRLEVESLGLRPDGRLPDDQEHNGLLRLRSPDPRRRSDEKKRRE